MTSTANTPDEPEFIGFVLSHKAFRAELPRLSSAFAIPLDDVACALAEEHLRLVTDHLVQHHDEEDSFHWPLLQARAPEATELLRALESEHGELDAVLDTVCDRSVPRPARAEALALLDRRVAEHTTQEDDYVVPLLRRHITAEEQAASMARSRAKIPPDDELRVLALMLDAGALSERHRMLAPLPDEVVTLWREHAAPALAAVHAALRGRTRP